MNCGCVITTNINTHTQIYILFKVISFYRIQFDVSQRAVTYINAITKQERKSIQKRKLFELVSRFEQAKNICN